MNTEEHGVNNRRQCNTRACLSMATNHIDFPLFYVCALAKSVTLPQKLIKGKAIYPKEQLAPNPPQKRVKSKALVHFS